MQRRKLGKTLALMIVLILSALPIIAISAPNVAVDVFTQKEPFSGRGPNATCDAFHPGEEVFLYATVSFNEVPLQNILVSFHVEGPPDTSPISFNRVSETNDTGLASASFTIPWAENDSNVIGNWTVFTSVEIDQFEFTDCLFFEVGWIIEVTSVRAIDETLATRNSFGIGGDIGVEISFRNIALTEKKATITLTLQDELNVPVAFLMMDEVWIQPNKTIIKMYSVLHMPVWGAVGKATLHISALTARPSEGGVPYAPAVSLDVHIVIGDPLEISLRDAAITKISLKESAITIGEVANLTVTARNEGAESESFEVQMFANATFIETLHFGSVTPYTQRTLSLQWNTSAFKPGSYVMSAQIPPLQDEAELEDNIYVDGIIRANPPPILIHDIAVVRIVADPQTVRVESPVHVNVTVGNEGTEVESFNVSAFFDDSLISTVLVSSLSSGVELNVTFVWDTSGLLVLS
jgi:hypothetical protein